MPIEIRELLIKAVVNSETVGKVSDEKQHSSDQKQKTKSNDLENLNLILEGIKNQNER